MARRKKRTTTRRRHHRTGTTPKAKIAHVIKTLHAVKNEIPGDHHRPVHRRRRRRRA